MIIIIITARKALKKSIWIVVLICELQMRQKQREMSQAYEDTRPLSDGSAYDSSIVSMRDKNRIQVKTAFKSVFFLL